MVELLLFGIGLGDGFCGLYKLVTHRLSGSAGASPWGDETMVIWEVFL